VRFDKKDRGKTNAALPASTRPNNTELTATDVFGLQKKPSEVNQLFCIVIKRNF